MAFEGVPRSREIGELDVQVFVSLTPALTAHAGRVDTADLGGGMAGQEVATSAPKIFSFRHASQFSRLALAPNRSSNQLHWSRH